MKTLTNTFLFFKQQTPLRWRGLGDFLKMVGYSLVSYLLAVPLATAYYLHHVPMSWMKGMTVHVDPVRPVIRAMTKALGSSFTINGRVYGGLVLVIVVAPFSACIHMIPGMKETVSIDWYYNSWYNLFLVLGPYFYCLCIVAAAFLWIPPVTKRIKFSQKPISFQITRALSIPFGLIVGKIVWLIFCDSNDDYERLGNPYFFAGGVAVSYVLFRVLEYLIWRQEHAMNALIDTLQGVYDMPNTDYEDRKKIAAPYWKELKEFHSKY